MVRRHRQCTSHRRDKSGTAVDRAVQRSGDSAVQLQQHGGAGKPRGLGRAFRTDLFCGAVGCSVVPNPGPAAITEYQNLQVRQGFEVVQFLPALPNGLSV